MVTWIGCPESNYRRGRPFGLHPQAVVVHIMDGSFEAGESVFRDPTTQKSAHYGISREGIIHQYVDENDTAFHAGIVVNPSWPLLKPRVNPNFYTIGIEHEGRPDDHWPDAQLSASAALISEIAQRWRIPLDDSHVIRHHEIRASKTCPGNWLQLSELLRRIPLLSPPAVVVASGPSHPTNGGGDAVHVLASVESPAIAATLQSATIAAAPHSPGPATLIAKATIAAIVSTDATTSPATIAPALAPIAMVVRTNRKVNLRRAKPVTNAQVVRVIPPHTEIAVTRVEIGDQVDGNAYWYADAQGNYFWAGATDTPDPRVIAA